MSDQKSDLSQLEMDVQCGAQGVLEYRAMERQQLNFRHSKDWHKKVTKFLSHSSSNIFTAYFAANVRVIHRTRLPLAGLAHETSRGLGR